MSKNLELRTTDHGVVIPVRVVPRANRTELDGVHDGALRVRVKAPPVEGAANKELTRFIAKQLGVPRGVVQIVSGERSRTKSVLIRDTTSGAILTRLLPDEGLSRRDRQS